MMQQLTLPIQWPESHRFEHFYPQSHWEVCRSLWALAHDVTTIQGLMYLWGVSGAGKTHLLQATCQASFEAGIQSGYLRLSLEGAADPGVLVGLVLRWGCRLSAGWEVG